MLRSSPPAAAARGLAGA